MQRDEPEKVVIHSWDFDGMLASTAYLDKMKELIIRAANENRSLTMKDYDELAEHILNKYSQFFLAEFSNQNAQHDLYVGSNRQNRDTDTLNGNLKGNAKTGFSITLSCFPFFEALAKKINEKFKVRLELKKFLLEDAYLNLRPGTIFEAEKNIWLQLDPTIIKDLAKLLQSQDKSDATDKHGNALHKILATTLTSKRNSNESTDCPTDDLKILLLLAQMNLAKLDHPDQVIEFKFADDRKDILEKAVAILQQNNIIPPNTTLQIQQFLPPDAEYRQLPAEQQVTNAARFGEFTSRSLTSNTNNVDAHVVTTTRQLFEMNAHDLAAYRSTDTFASLVQQAQINSMLHFIVTRLASVYEDLEKNKIVSSLSHKTDMDFIKQEINGIVLSKETETNKLVAVKNILIRYFMLQFNQWKVKESPTLPFFKKTNPDEKTMNDFIKDLNQHPNDNHYSRLLGLMILDCYNKLGEAGAVKASADRADIQLAPALAGIQIPQKKKNNIIYRELFPNIVTSSKDRSLLQYR